MTYCIGILLNEGLVLASDSRTNAGIDRVSTVRKMHVLERRGERFFALLTAGNLSLTQGVMSLLGEWLDTGDPEKDLWAVGSMFAAARAVGDDPWYEGPLLDMYNTAVVPAFAGADADLDLASDAIRAAFVWERHVQLLGLDEAAPFEAMSASLKRKINHLLDRVAAGPLPPAATAAESRSSKPSCR